MKFAAIDIGSNAVRFQISRPLQEDKENSIFKKVEYTRLPLRLGEDVFTKGRIGDKKKKLLTKAMQAFDFLMDIYNVDGYMACATSAMRDAKNSKEIIEEIEDKTGIKIKVISGKKESELIRNAVLEDLPSNNGYIHIDVGGGSTEVSFIKKNKVIASESFDVGTVRLFEKADIKKDLNTMMDWVKKQSKEYDSWISLGSGGNINKLFRLISESKFGWLEYKVMKEQLHSLSKYSKKQKVYELGLNPDRAEVIEHASKIYLDVMKWSGSEKMYVSGKGLKEGIIKDLWTKHFNR